MLSDNVDLHTASPLLRGSGSGVFPNPPGLVFFGMTELKQLLLSLRRPKVLSSEHIPGGSEPVEPLCPRLQGGALQGRGANVVAQLVQIFGHHVEGNGHKALGSHPGHWDREDGDESS